MSNYLDPDRDHATQGPAFDLPARLEDGSEIMQASGLVLHRYGLLLCGPSGSGKSMLQRRLRQEARARGMFAALISDDYVRLSRPGPDGKEEAVPPLLAFSPVPTHRLQEVRGIGVLKLEPEHVLSRAVIHLLVDMVAPEEIERMPRKMARSKPCLGHEVAHLAVPQRSVDVACDMVFALLSTWKH
ncbi:hypothetical protein SAMN04515647_0297 [Cohaesibacter sp. ES.047]|uniref:HPr kinase/phosphorylase n=1 Tax=Cohaesibacter sp. ES.047 TaxID=1798205 RepID=UPI000BB756DB|nr:hypothetical protein [Cohaesibacter sp. ES.047]SNY90150.1 hypothetical protein SAMN04515647_0297 [Cohaesibacter sp. ES.047]